MKRSSEVVVGLVVILGLALVVFGTIWLQRTRLGSEEIEVRARFREVGQLLAGGTVKLRGVPIGRVEDIELESTGAAVVITMSIRSDVRLPTDGVVILSPESMFGDWQAEIASRGTYPTYEFAAAPEPDVLPGYALPDMSRLTAVADQIAQNMASLSHKIDRAFTDETAENVRLAIENIQDVSEQLTGLVSKQQVALDEVAANLSRTSEAAGQAAETMDRTFSQVEAAISGGRLNTIVRNIEGSTARADSLATELMAASRDLRRMALGADTALRRVGGIAAAAERGEGSLGRLLQDTSLYLNLSESSMQLQALLRDIREHPRKYINLTIF